MIARAVIKTAEGVKTAGDSKQLTETIGLHNLTELRQKLDEKMVLKLNERNRPADQMADKWPTYPATPSDSEDARSFGSGGGRDSIDEAYDEAYAESCQQNSSSEVQIASEL